MRFNKGIGMGIQAYLHIGEGTYVFQHTKETSVSNSRIAVL